MISLTRTISSSTPSYGRRRTTPPGLLWTAALLCTFGLIVAGPAVAGTVEPPAGTTAIADVPALLRDVADGQKHIDQVREDYDYTETVETREMDGRGGVKETRTEEFEIFYVNGREIRRLVKRNGKPLEAGEEKKEQDRATKAVEKAAQNSRDEGSKDDSLSISRIIENVIWRNPRRELRNGRETIVFDFLSNPHAKTHSREEEAFRDLSGTAWIDEKDRTIARLYARFDQDFHIGGGMLASVHKGSTMTLDQGLINHEVWLPVKVQLHLDARVLLFKGISEEIAITTSNYKKFSVSSSQQAGAKARPPG
ncbi:MAG TPA: hypothetical protein VGD59_11710 [Acidisarcina sp.]